MLTKSVLLIVYFLGVLSGCLMMYLAGVFVKAQFEAEAERRNQAQLKKQIFAKDGEPASERVSDVAPLVARQERARRIAKLN